MTRAEIVTMLAGDIRMKVPICQWAAMVAHFEKFQQRGVAFEGPGTMFGIVEHCNNAQAEVVRLLFRGEMLPPRTVPKS